MPRKGENIYKRKDGRWEGRIIKEHDISGKAKYMSVYGKSYSEVKLKIQDLRISQALEKPAKTAHIIVYSDLIDLWLVAIKPTVKESTFARYHQLINTHIRPKLGKRQSTEITVALINQYTEQLLVSGRRDGNGGLAPKSVNDILCIANTVQRRFWMLAGWPRRTKAKT